LNSRYLFPILNAAFTKKFDFTPTKFKVEVPGRGFDFHSLIYSFTQDSRQAGKSDRWKVWSLWTGRVVGAIGGWDRCAVRVQQYVCRRGTELYRYVGPLGPTPVTLSRLLNVLYEYQYQVPGNRYLSLPVAGSGSESLTWIPRVQCEARRSRVQYYLLRK
jgi:hypothetical protein